MNDKIALIAMAVVAVYGIMAILWVTFLIAGVLILVT